MTTFVNLLYLAYTLSVKLTEDLMACKRRTRYKIEGLWTPVKYHQCIRGELRGRKFRGQQAARKAFRVAVKKCVRLTKRK